MTDVIVDGINLRESMQAISFVIAPCVEDVDADECRRVEPHQADFWSIYHTMPATTEDRATPLQPLDGMQLALADFDTEEEARAFVDAIRGNRPLFRFTATGGYVRQ